MHYDAATMDLTPGTRIEGWIVEGVLGRGAMATVYAVRHEILDTRAALKVLDRADETLEQRLIREGRAQGSIDHPGIVGVLDHLRVHGHAALLLERVDGGDLRTLLERGPLPRDVALDLFRRITEAVAAAHRVGLVHRDLKPSNVLLQRVSERWFAKVGDFGLVKTVDGDLTATHGVVGTPRTMAPEQMRASRRVDARADVFSLGCLLYELVTGSQPFAGDDWVALHAAKDGGHYADPASLVPDLPSEILRAITGSLQGAPAHRIPSCDVLLRVLDGEPWTPPDATVDLQGLPLCPACGAPAAGPDEPACVACGASLALAERYQLVELLAESIGTRVWRALDLKDGRWVVARALLPGADATTRQRFERGVSVALQLDHPQIVRPLCPTFEEHGRLWEVRPWVEGRSLAEALEHHRFDVAEVLEVIEGLSEPLRYLAQRSPPVVHRAVTPANVVRGSDGRLVLLDFAQVRDQVADASLHDVPEGAPEQWVGEATPATDVYGLGTLAATLLTRRPGRALAHHDRLSGIRDDLRALLLQMRDADPAKRPAIEEVARRSRALQLPVPTGTRSRLRPALFGLASVVLAFVAVLAAYRSPEPDRPVPAPVAPPSPERLHAPGADLAGRRVPGADCGEGHDATVLLDTSATGPRPVVGVTCDGQAHLLGAAEPGVPLDVPGEARVGLGWGHWERATPAVPVRLRVLPPRRVVGEDRQPLPGAFVTPQRYASWARSTTGMPLLSQPIRLSEDPWVPAAVGAVSGEDGTAAIGWPFDVSVQVDGVYHPSATLAGGELWVPAVHSTRVVRVVAQSDAPVADAEVVCVPGKPDAPIVHARTGEDGRARCGSRDEPHRWAVVDAPGRVADITELVDGEVRVELRAARRILVGCYGPEGDTCDTLQTPPVCVGSAGRSSGICRSVGDAMVCDCAPDANRIQHGVLGRVAIPEDADAVWFDLRAFQGTVSGQLEGASRACEITFSTPFGALGTRTLRDGSFRFTSLPEGGYAVSASCGGRSLDLGSVAIPSASAHVVLPPATAPRPVVLHQLPRPDREEEQDIERILEDYALPSWPEGAEATGRVSCEARTTIGADGSAVSVSISGCAEPFAQAAEAAVLGWRWAPGDRETTETLQVPFEDQ